MTDDASVGVAVPVPLRWSDMDAYGHVNNTEFLRLLEQARVEGLSMARTPGLFAMLVVRHEIEYLRPLTYRSAGVIVRMWCSGVGGAGFDLSSSVESVESVESAESVESVESAAPSRAGSAEGPQVFARACTTMVAFDLAADSVRRLTDDERAVLADIAGPPITFRRPSRSAVEATR